MALERTRKHLALYHLSNKNNSNSSNNSSNNNNNNKTIQWLPCHAIDLKQKSSEITAHVDSIRFSGEIVAGLSLGSASIMRLQQPILSATNNIDVDVDVDVDVDNSDDDDDNNDQKEDNSGDGHVDLYLPPLSLYVLSGVGRYELTHEILPSGMEFTFQSFPKQSSPRERFNGNNSNDCEDDILNKSNDDDDDDDDDDIDAMTNRKTIIVDRDRRISIIFRDAKNKNS